jgi:far upstream element-binding protein
VSAERRADDVLAKVQFGAGISRVVECPKGMVGRVIGKGGETIKALQRTYQVRSSL